MPTRFSRRLSTIQHAIGGLRTLARRLAAGNLNCLPAAARDGIAGTGGVVVVVATVSHAIVLAEMLDGWAIVSGNSNRP